MMMLGTPVTDGGMGMLELTVRAKMHRCCHPA